MKKLLILLLIPVTSCIYMDKPFVVSRIEMNEDWTKYYSKNHHSAIYSKDMYHVGDTIKLCR